MFPITNEINYFLKRNKKSDKNEESHSIFTNAFLTKSSWITKSQSRARTWFDLQLSERQQNRQLLRISTFPDWFKKTKTDTFVIIFLAQLFLDIINSFLLLQDNSCHTIIEEFVDLKRCFIFSKLQKLHYVLFGDLSGWNHLHLFLKRLICE